MKELDQKILQSHLSSIYKDKNIKQIDFLCSEIRKNVGLNVFQGKKNKDVKNLIKNFNKKFDKLTEDKNLTVETLKTQAFKQVELFLNELIKIRNFQITKNSDQEMKWKLWQKIILTTWKWLYTSEICCTFLCTSYHCEFVTTLLLLLLVTNFHT